MKFFLPLLVFAFVSNTLIASEKKAMPETLAGTTLVSAEELIDLFDKYENLVLIDSRKPSDQVAGYIEGAVALPDFETTPKTLTKAIPSKDTPIAFYCNGPKCSRSYKAAKIAIADGYTKIYWFRGGWKEWSDKGLPAVKN